MTVQYQTVEKYFIYPISHTILLTDIVNIMHFAGHRKLEACVVGKIPKKDKVNSLIEFCS